MKEIVGLPYWLEHYKYMPDAEGDPLFQERIDEMRLDREFSRVVTRYNSANILSIERFISDHHDSSSDLPRTITVHPDTYYARYASTYISRINEVSEDVVTLGKRGAEVIAQVDPVLESFNQCVTELEPKYHREYTRVHSMLSLLNLKSSQMKAQYNKLDAACAKIDRVDIEIYIREHPNMSADEICGIIRDNEAWLREHTDSFINAARKTATHLTSMLLDPPDREQILKKYHTMAKKLNRHLLKNFIENLTSHRPAEDISYPKSDRVYWRFTGNSNTISTVQHIAWLIETNGFTSISTMGVQQYTFTNIDDFVVAMHQIIKRKSKYSNFKIMATINRPLTSEFYTVMKLPSLIEGVARTYRNSEFSYSPDIMKLYEDYTTMVNAAFDTKPTEVSFSQYISDMVHYITDESHMVSERIRLLDTAYTRSRAAQLASLRSTAVTDDASPYDYEIGIRNAIDQITSSSCCVVNGKTALYTHFSYTDDTKDDGIGMCLVLNVLKDFIDSICFTANGKRIEYTTNGYNVLYKALKSNSYGSSFKIPGMIYWNTDNVFAFTASLQREFDFLW